jgi:hypothetical protein
VCMVYSTQLTGKGSGYRRLFSGQTENTAARVENLRPAEYM